eukprot:Gb_01224 [translate_table: standard]
MRTEKVCSDSEFLESNFLRCREAGEGKTEHTFIDKNRDDNLIVGNSWKLALKDIMSIRHIGKRSRNFDANIGKKKEWMEEFGVEDDGKASQRNTNSNGSILHANDDDTNQSLNAVSGCSSFRKRKRKQESDRIYRVNGAVLDKKNVAENSEAKEIKEFVNYFVEELKNLLPNEMGLKQSTSFTENMELCKRLARQAGISIREKNLLLDGEYSKICELEQALINERKLKETLKSELGSLKDRLDDILSAAEEGNKSNCAYCSSILGQMGNQKNQNNATMVLRSLGTEGIASSEAVEISCAQVIQDKLTPSDLASEEVLTSNSGVPNFNVLTLKPIKREMNGQTQEGKGNVKKRKMVTKSNGLLKACERGQKGRLYLESKSSSVLSEFQGSENVTEMHLQREVVDSVKQTVCSDGKEVDYKQDHAMLEKGVAFEIDEEDDAVESIESHPNCASVKVEEKDPNGSTEDSEGTGIYNDVDLIDLLKLKKGSQFIEMKCGCTSQKYGDTVGTLRVYQTGEFEIYCECMAGCEKGKPMSPAAFEKHGGRGSSRKWRFSIWILVRDQKVQLSRVKELEPYYRKYKAMKTPKASEMGNTRQAFHRDEFVRCSKCHQERRFKRRNKEECRLYHDALANPDWECSNLQYDRFLFL